MRQWLAAIGLGLLLLLSACDARRVSAEERIFLPLSLDYVGECELNDLEFEDTPIGGLSGLSYDRDRDRFYVLSDDKSRLAPARFYTVAMQLDPDAGINRIAIENVTFLQTPKEENFPGGSLDPEGIALLPANEIYVSSEGNFNAAIEPFIARFNLETGTWQDALPLPPYYIWDEEGQGIQNNAGFEALTLNPGARNSQGEPYRVFVATESPLQQDLELEEGISTIRNRLLHYAIVDGTPQFIAEHLYPLDVANPSVVANGLTEMVALDEAGHFLSLERTYSPFSGTAVKIFQFAIADATDILGRSRLGEAADVRSIRKQLLWSSRDAGVTVDNLEGMTLGPRLSDGSQSLVLVSDDNFNQFASPQVTQFLLFRLERE